MKFLFVTNLVSATGCMDASSKKAAALTYSYFGGAGQKSIGIGRRSWSSPGRE